MNHARGDMRADCSMVECRGAGGGRGEKFDGGTKKAGGLPRKARQAEPEPEPQRRGGEPERGGRVRFFSGDCEGSAGVLNAGPSPGCGGTAISRQGKWEIGGARTTWRLAVKSEKSAISDLDCLRRQNPCRMSLRFASEGGGHWWTIVRTGNLLM